jgi:hypothetical protein
VTACRWMALAAATLLAALSACGPKNAAKEPMVADSTASEMSSGDDAGAAAAAGDTDGGAESAGESDAGAGAAGILAAGTTGGGKDVIAQGDEEGAQALLKQFVAPNADHAALTKSLKPTTSDYKALFDAATAAKVEAAQAKDWATNKAVIKPKQGQTDVKLWSASGADLVAGKGSAKEFPAGYKKIAKHLAPTVLFYRFKFVEGGKDQGTAYDGLAFVNSHWVIAPKPWRALEKGDDEDAPPKKPRGKGKKKA